MARWRFVYGKKPYLVKLSKRETIDIDDEKDFLMSESISNLKIKNEQRYIQQPICFGAC